MDKQIKNREENAFTYKSRILFYFNLASIPCMVFVAKLSDVVNKH